MSQKVFVTGLPRSRTAWLANWLSWGESICLHDAFQHAPSFEAFCDTLNALPYQVVGHSDPANVFVWRKLQETYPGAKWIVIERDFEAVYVSCKRTFGWTSREPLWRMADRLEELRAAVQPIVLDFNAFNLGPQASRYLGLPWSSVRATQLAHMQVQVESNWLKQQVEKLQAAPHWLKEAA